MPLSEQQLLELEIETAWETFMDTDPERHAGMLKRLDPPMYQMIKLAYQHGYSDGAQSVLRGVPE